jgi:hypothetical protein
MKKAIEVAVYMMPSILGSVVVTIRYMNDPLTPVRGGNGRVGVSSATVLTARPHHVGLVTRMIRIRHSLSAWLPSR